MFHKVKLFSISILSIFLLLISVSSEARLYKWVDTNGEVRYGDQLPPEFNNKKHFQLDAEGRVIMTKEAGKSPQQLKDERALAKKEKEEKETADKEAKKQKTKQDRQDKILLLTFNSESDIFYARDQRLQLLDYKINLLNINKLTSQNKLNILEKQADELYLSKGAEIPGGFQQKIEQMRKKLVTANKDINLSQFKREDVLTEFKKDLARFRNLKARQRKNKK